MNGRLFSIALVTAMGVVTHRATSVAQTSPGAQLAAVDELFAAELSKEPYAGVTGVVV